MRDVWSSFICSVFAILHSTSFSAPNISGLGHYCVAGGDQCFVFGYCSGAMCAVGEGGLECGFVSDVGVGVGDSICPGR